MAYDIMLPFILNIDDHGYITWTSGHLPLWKQQICIHDGITITWLAECQRFYCQRWIQLKPEDFLIQNCQTKPKGVTTQMKAFNEYMYSNGKVLVIAEESSFPCF